MKKKKEKEEMAAAPPAPAQLYGDPAKVASEALDVLVAASPNLVRLDAGDETIKVVLDRSSFEAANPKGKGSSEKPQKQLVAVLAGGGSGHEPMAAGYVGPGCLSGAIAGDVFASPSTEAVRAALRAFERSAAGVVLLVNNYTGDRLCFGAAAEAARAGGQKVEVVFVSDDVALLRKEGAGGEGGEGGGGGGGGEEDLDAGSVDEAEEASFALSRRRARGLAGCVLVFKVAGAAAAAGLPLAEVAAAARRAAAALATMGLATSACALPGLSPPAGRCRPGAVELGMGLHGEAGAEVVDGPAPASELARALWTRIEPHAARRARALLRGSSPPSRSPSFSSSSKPRAVLLVNSLGGCSVLEASALAAAALPLARARFDVARLLVGPFCTSLDMRGASVTVLPVDDELLSLVDAAVAVPAWPSSGAGVCCGAGEGDSRVARLEGANAAAAPPSVPLFLAPPPSPIPFDASVVARCLSAAAAAISAARSRLDELDGRAGDGDCGATLAGAAKDVAGAVAAGDLPIAPGGGGGLAATASAVGALVARAGGTSGGVYDIFFSAAAASLRAAEQAEGAQGNAGGQGKDLPSALAGALSAAAAAVSLHGGAVEGDRTLLDALLPAARAAVAESAAAAKEEEGDGGSAGRGLAVARAAAAAAEAGAAATAAMARAGAGRSAYVRAEALLGHADPGAVGVATWLRAVAGALE